MTTDDSNKLPPVPVGIQCLLRLAAVDEAFLAELQQHRELAARAAGVKLTPNELAILRAIPGEQLGLMARSLAEHAREERAGDILPTVASQGIRPDQPPERPGLPEAPTGIHLDEPTERPEEVWICTGILPDEPPKRPLVASVVKGIRPTPVVAAAAALVIGGVVVAECTGACDRLLGSDSPTADERSDD